MDWSRTLATLADHGLNVVGVAAGTAYTHVLPRCRSVVVLGSGGRRLWDRFVQHLTAEPRALIEQPHPLDAFVEGLLRAADPDPGPDRRWVRCAADDGQDLDFRSLAWGAGLGWPSPMGLLLHPTFGPWIGLRAACFTTEALKPTPLAQLPVCGRCEAPCATACPAGAVAKARPFDLGACAAFHRTPGPCATTCHSRRACPVGQDHQYSDLQLHYHADRATGRPRLAAAVGLDHDPHDGVGPFWDRAPDPCSVRTP